MEVRQAGYQTYSDRINVQENTTCSIENRKLGKGQKERITCDVNGVSFDMIRVEAGTFKMGATSEMLEMLDQDEWPSAKPYNW